MQSGFGRTLLIAVAAVATLPPAGGATAADSGWMSLNQTDAYLKKLKTVNDLPVAIECRNDSKVAGVWKPSVRLQSRPNSANTEWYIIAKVDARDWQPGIVGATDRPKWRVVSRVVVQGGAGGTKLWCTIWRV